MFRKSITTKCINLTAFLFGIPPNIMSLIQLPEQKSGIKYQPRGVTIRLLFYYPHYAIIIMELTSKDGNMVVNFYPVKTWDNNLIDNRILKVLRFRGDKQKKMLISRDEFYYQVKEYMNHKYKIISEYMPPQFIKQEDYCHV